MSRLIENKKAGFNYEILEKLETGIELLGFEVKTIRSGHGSFEGSHVLVRNGQVFLINANIPPYQPNNTPKDYEPTRSRRLLLTKKEIEQLQRTEKQHKLTIVPLSAYNKGRKIKIEIAVVRGKKKFDKREVIKKRETDREIRRTLKSRPM